MFVLLDVQVWWFDDGMIERGWFQEMMVSPRMKVVWAMAGVVLYARIILWLVPMHTMVASISASILTVVGLLGLAAAAWRRSWKFETVVMGAMLTSFLPVMFLAKGLIGLVFGHALSEVKAYQAKVAPLLEAHRDRHKRYPEELAELSGAPAVPRLLRPGGYWAQGDGEAASYRITISAPPGGAYSMWRYDSGTDEWVSIED